MSASALFRRAAVAPRMASAARAFSTTPSNNVARITIVGNLADAPEVVPTSTGREIIRYAVASNSGPKDNRQTSWFRVTSFEAEGPRRDFLQSLPKGTLVYVEGEAAMRAYQDAEGKNRSSLSIIQRTSSPHSTYHPNANRLSRVTGSIEVLKRPYTGNNGGEASE
ncbi:single-strand binding protein family [Colletotrichum limetticola]|uniref:Single-strand binding protein family n=1 Tax=Colletotrichum limetticola TaxID=1209924 RepID=A0ABQ9Q698_9PEZI|nr:single-strand binding protein family [Colletotrichum limetticola]